MNQFISYMSVAFYIFDYGILHMTQRKKNKKRKKINQFLREISPINFTHIYKLYLAVLHRASRSLSTSFYVCIISSRIWKWIINEFCGKIVVLIRYKLLFNHIIKYYFRREDNQIFDIYIELATSYKVGELMQRALRTHAAVSLKRIRIVLTKQTPPVQV